MYTLLMNPAHFFLRFITLSFPGIPCPTACFLCLNNPTFIHQPRCMASLFRIGILRETRQPPDLRVPFTPLHCRAISDRFHEIEFLVQPSPFRSYTDEEYKTNGIKVQEDLSGCDLIMGVKEVDPDTMVQGKK